MLGTAGRCAAALRGRAVACRRPIIAVGLRGTQSLAHPLGPITPKLISPEQVEKVYERDEELRSKYMRLPEAVPAASFAPNQDLTQDEVFRKRLVYRSKQRGWLEVDLLLGSWADKHVMGLSDEEARQYEQILEMETIDIYNYLTGRSPVPEELTTPIMRSLQEWAASSPFGKASPEAYAKMKSIFSN